MFRLSTPVARPTERVPCLFTAGTDLAGFGPETSTFLDNRTLRLNTSEPHGVVDAPLKHGEWARTVHAPRGAPDRQPRVARERFALARKGAPLIYYYYYYYY